MKTRTPSLSSKHRNHQAPRRFRPSFESLEDRCVPALISGLPTTQEGQYALTLNAEGSTTVTGWDINWGDGTAHTITSGAGANPVGVGHYYADGPNNYTITATMTDAG